MGLLLPRHATGVPWVCHGCAMVCVDTTVLCRMWGVNMCIQQIGQLNMLGLLPPCDTPVLVLLRLYIKKLVRWINLLFLPGPRGHCTLTRSARALHPHLVHAGTSPSPGWSPAPSRCAWRYSLQSETIHHCLAFTYYLLPIEYPRAT